MLSTIETLGLIFFAAFLFTFVSAWMNEKIIRVEKEKRKFAEVFLLVISWSLISYFAFGFTLWALVAFCIPIVFRYAFFDPILNMLMGWGNFFVGTTSKIDRLSKKFKIPFWFRYVVLVIFVGVVVFIYFKYL